MQLVGFAAYQGKTIEAYEIVGSALDPAAQVTDNVLTVKTLLSPLTAREVGIVRCLGLNYSDHAVGALASLYRSTSSIRLLGGGKDGETCVSTQSEVKKPI